MTLESNGKTIFDHWKKDRCISLIYTADPSCIYAHALHTTWNPQFTYANKSILNTVLRVTAHYVRNGWTEHSNNELIYT